MVLPRLAGSMSGLQTDDIIIQINHSKILTETDFLEIMATLLPSEMYPMMILRPLLDNKLDMTLQYEKLTLNLHVGCEGYSMGDLEALTRLAKGQAATDEEYIAFITGELGS